MSDLNLGAILLSARKQRRLSQTTLSRRLNRPRTWVSKIENGHCIPNVESLCRIGAELAVDGWELLRRAQEAQRAARAAGGRV